MKKSATAQGKQKEVVSDSDVFDDNAQDDDADEDADEYRPASPAHSIPPFATLDTSEAIDIDTEDAVDHVMSSSAEVKTKPKPRKTGAKAKKAAPKPAEAPAKGKKAAKDAPPAKPIVEISTPSRSKSAGKTKSAPPKAATPEAEEEDQVVESDNEKLPGGYPLLPKRALDIYEQLLPTSIFMKSPEAVEVLLSRPDPIPKVREVVLSLFRRSLLSLLLGFHALSIEGLLVGPNQVHSLQGKFGQVRPLPKGSRPLHLAVSRDWLHPR